MNSALASQYTNVKEFFAGDNGLIPRLKEVVSPYTATGGLLETRIEALNMTKSQLTEQQEALDRRIENLTTTLYTKYNNMDTLVAQLTATSNSIMSTLNALNNSKD